MTTGHLLYPRISLEIARGILEETVDLMPAELRNRGAIEHPSQTFAATGGSRVEPGRLDEIQSGIRSLADRCGWPEGPSLEQRRAFDSGGAALLNRRMGIVPADAGSDGVWMFMTMVLSPEITPWRWESRNEKRYLNSFRNTFRSMFWRGYVLGSERLERFSADELSSIVERPSLSANPRIARALLDTYAIARAQLSDGVRESVMRDYAKRLRRFVSFISLDALTDRQLERLLTETLEATLTSLEIEGIELPEWRHPHVRPEAPISPSTGPVRTGELKYRPRRHRSRYAPLWTALVEWEETTWRLRLTDINRILGFGLPHGARTHPEVWYDESRSDLARAIKDAGWRVRGLNLPLGVVELVRPVKR